MPTPLSHHTSTRFDPGLIETATRHAHALRRQAIEDALRALGRWLSRPFGSRPQTSAPNKPCHSQP